MRKMSKFAMKTLEKNVNTIDKLCKMFYTYFKLYNLFCDRFQLLQRRKEL